MFKRTVFIPDCLPPQIHGNQEEDLQSLLFSVLFGHLTRAHYFLNERETVFLF